MTWAIGVDIGGTFTDCVGIDPEGRLHYAKAISTQDTDVSEGVLAALDELAHQAGQGTSALLGQTTRLGHGTTIGTNLLVERRGARVGLITTAGHRDVLTMMRGAGRTAGIPIDRVFDVRATSKPAPLVPRAAIAEVHERVAADGTVVAPLDENAARETIRALLDGDCELQGVAITLLWSFRNDAHERRLAELVDEVAPDAFVSLSSRVAPRQGEYERTVAAVINSYVGPESADGPADHRSVHLPPAAPGRALDRVRRRVDRVDRARRRAQGRATLRWVVAWAGLLPEGRHRADGH
jgi:N-methylhydantoinase A